ncbi:MAG TPA: hypothetical protein VKY89_19095, partial [Thermoanaerobaculia bacterium]|nr:hypothetical protein [Thermoanaerobaculia bacterium]
RLRACLPISLWAASSLLHSSGITAQQPTNLASPPITAQQPANPASAPDMLRMPREEGFTGPTTWISAKAAADPDRVLKWELLDDSNAANPSLQGSIRDQEQARQATRGSAEVANVPESQCPSHTITQPDTPERPAETFADLVANSIGIYAGTITAVTPGFSSNVPSELLTVKVEDTLRAAVDQPVPLTDLQLFYGVAHFRIGSYIFCGLSSSGWGEPQVGDQVLVFVYRWVRQGQSFVDPVENQLVFGTKKGLYIPVPVRRDERLHVNKFGAVVDAVRQAVRQRQAVPGPAGERP